MSPKDLLLALVVIIVWGLNFVVIKVGLHDMPPMLLGALRFILAAFPAILFVKRPQIPLRWLLLYGLQGDRLITMAGFALTIGAASMWALGNIVTRKLGKVNLVGLVVWGSLIPPLPFFALSWLLEGPDAIEAALRGFSLNSMLVLIYLAFGATILGYGLWSRLLSRYPASQVAPFSLLVPVVGITSAALLLDERLSTLQLLGALLVMLGLLLNVCGGWLQERLRARWA